jgi:hypothetical protein
VTPVKQHACRHVAKRILQTYAARGSHDGLSPTSTPVLQQHGACLKSVWVPWAIGRLHIRAGVLLIPIGQKRPVECL